MKKILFPLAIVTTLILSAFTTINAVKWNVAEGYSIQFTSDNPAGIFNSLKGDIVFDPANLSGSSFDMVIDVNSINTGNGMKNKHAKSKKWFGADTYPTITFKSTSITAKDGAYEVTGNLKIRETEKSITFPFTFDNNTFKGGFTINRLDYGIGTNKGMSANAATELKVDISVPVTQ